MLRTALEPQKALEIISYHYRGGVSGKEPACQFRRHKRFGFGPWVRKIPQRGGHSNPLQYSSLENPMDKRRLQFIGLQRVR